MGLFFIHSKVHGHVYAPAASTMKLWIVTNFPVVHPLKYLASWWVIQIELVTFVLAEPIALSVKVEYFVLITHESPQRFQHQLAKIR